jgi:tetratricopeptide (TPR) repeat protein
MVHELLSARWLSPAQRSEASRFHGVWTSDDVTTIADQAQVAHWEWDLNNPALQHNDTPALLRAHTHIRRGEATDALLLLQDTPASIQRDALLGEVLLLLNRTANARTLLQSAATAKWSTAPQARAVLRATSLLQQLNANGASTATSEQLHLGALAAARVDLDPAYWPLLIDEAVRLEARGQRNQAVTALREALLLNARAAEAWFMLGQLHLRVLNFDGLDASVAALRLINEEHVLATLLEAEAALVQQQWATAKALLATIDPLPPHGEALFVAHAALQGQHAAANARADQARRHLPGDAQLPATVGSMLSFHRRYDDADRWLRQAITQAPGDHRVWSDLGLMRMQAARDADAQVALERAVKLDPFDHRAANSLRLLQDMAKWSEVTRGDVTLRWKPGVDELFARAIASDVAELHDAVELATHWTPSRPTIIELHPDHEHFAVRITGLPDVHTIAACTGPLIAMEVPRRGAPGVHGGPFNWRRVLMHELTHTAHLEMSNANVPLWLTEGGATAGEPIPLSFPTRVLLAQRWHEGTLLDFDELSWSFVRPARKDNRQLAYAQSAWFVQYLTDRFGPSVLPNIIASLGERASLAEAFVNHTDNDVQALWTDFLDQHVPGDLQSWGLDQVLPSTTASADLQTLRTLVAADDTNVALLNVMLRKALADRPPSQSDIVQLEQLAAARPLDPWPMLQRVTWHEHQGDMAQAADILGQVAEAKGNDPDLFDRLAMLHRKVGDVEASLAAMASAVELDPFDVTRRERAAALAVEAGRKPLAITHIEAMMLLEPNEALHHKRRAAIAD